MRLTKGLLAGAIAMMSCGGDPASSNDDDRNGPPAAPTDVRVTVVSFEKILLRWQCASTDVDFFRILRADNTGPLDTLDDVAGTAREFTDNAVFAQETYIYRIMARNQAGQSLSEPTAPVTTPAETP